MVVERKKIPLIGGKELSVNEVKCNLLGGVQPSAISSIFPSVYTVYEHLSLRSLGNM